MQSENHFFYLQHHQALFVVVFSPKTNKEKFEFLDQNHGLTLWKSITFYTLKNCRFRSLKFFIYTNIIKHYSSWYFRPSALRTTFCATHCQCLKKFSRLSLHFIITLISSVPCVSPGAFRT